MLDETPITWDDTVYLTWHADDGFMLEKYSKSDTTFEEPEKIESDEEPVEIIEGSRE